MMLNKAQQIAQQVANDVAPSSMGQCLKYVRKGIQRALGLKDQATGIESACDAGKWLEQIGFTEVYGSSYENGDVMIIKAEANHKHGHIQVKKGNCWYSDFKQDTPYPWIGCKVDSVYRYTK